MTEAERVEVARKVIDALLEDFEDSAEGSELTLTNSDEEGKPIGTSRVWLFTEHDVKDWLRGCKQDDGWLKETLGDDG